MSAVSTFFIYFLLSQRSQLNKLQKQLDQKKSEDQPESQSLPEVKQTSKEKLPINPSHTSSYDEFSENLQIIKDLQSQLDGLNVELKIRGEMIVERDNQITDLEKIIQTQEKTIHDLSAQISIFKGQIAPALEQTITDLRDREDRLEETIAQQFKELAEKGHRIEASQKILKRAGMEKLVQMEDLQMELNEKDEIIQSLKEDIRHLTFQVEQLPYICLQLTNEIKKRDTKINEMSVYNNVLTKKLNLAQKELELANHKDTNTIHELTNKIMELTDQLQSEQDKIALLDKEILMLNGLVLEKESKIGKLEEKIQKFLS